MSVQIEESGPVERLLRIEVPIAEVDAAFDQVYRRLQQKSRVKGFRPGKTPRSVLEKYFGEQVRSDVLEVVVRETLGKALEESELPVISEPQLKPDDVPKQGAPFVYQATVEIRPKVELAQVRGLAVARPPFAEPEQDPVDAHLEELRRSHATLTEEEEGATLSRGHLAVLNYEGTIDGEAFEGGKDDDVELEIGSEQALPGFDEALIGMGRGESREFDLDVPEDDGRPEVAGKQIHFSVELVSIKKRVLADLDDEFAKDVSDFDTLEAFRGDLRRRVDEGREREQKRQLREAVIDAAIAANPFPVPPSMVQRQLTSRMTRAVQQLRGRVPDDTLRQMVDSWAEEWKGAAERDVRVAFLVHEIADSEGFQVTDEDYEERLRQLAEDSGRDLAQVQREYKQAGADAGLRQALLEERVIDFLTTEATLSDS